MNYSRISKVRNSVKNGQILKTIEHRRPKTISGSSHHQYHRPSSSTLAIQPLCNYDANLSSSTCREGKMQFIYLFDVKGVDVLSSGRNAKSHNVKAKWQNDCSKLCTCRN